MTISNTGFPFEIIIILSSDENTVKQSRALVPALVSGGSEFVKFTKIRVTNLVILIICGSGHANC